MLPPVPTTTNSSGFTSFKMNCSMRFHSLGSTTSFSTRTVPNLKLLRATQLPCFKTDSSVEPPPTSMHIRLGRSFHLLFLKLLNIRSASSFPAIKSISTPLAAFTAAHTSELFSAVRTALVAQALYRSTPCTSIKSLNDCMTLANRSMEDSARRPESNTLDPSRNGTR